jgi:hypothetical protein
VEVENLAEPNRLPQPQNVYVVWAETGQGPQNLGQLKTSTGLFSSKLKAQLETVTPYQPSRILLQLKRHQQCQHLAIIRS